MAPPVDTDDLDDLDGEYAPTDVLDQFSRPEPIASATVPTSPLTSPPPPPPTATAQSFGRPRTNTRIDAPHAPAPGLGLPATVEADEDALPADFAAELAKGMESLMREIAMGAGEAPGSGSASDDAALKAAWEAMLAEGMDGLPSAESATAPTSSGTHPADFQSKIKQAMGKLREGEETLQDTSGAPAPDSLEALLAQLGDLGAGTDGAELPADEAELAGFLENMMGELMSKDVLQEPLTELADKFPPYLASPPAPLEASDRLRYEEQLKRVRAILALFDAPTFDDADPPTREKIVALMAEMQSFGSPPAELMGPLPPGLGALGEDGCVLC
ncbi:Pex19 protein family-domain-containing protein [Mycena belliarum]|uniref:Pex19 protein family-domain-containing protein n=1 Tax=Mycena belliarum TaxID=1033014 RepID=A0AAD6XII5_9AGAR|nr:Pex19 protein family-domain-containing protein [Mycena belliae]